MNSSKSSSKSKDKTSNYNSQKEVKQDEIKSFKKIKHKLKILKIKNINENSVSIINTNKKQQINEINKQNSNNSIFNENKNLKFENSQLSRGSEKNLNENQQQKYDEVQLLVKDFLRLGYKANLILKMDKDMYREYLYKIWDNNKHIDYKQIMQNNHKNIIWWQNQLIPKKYLKLITELVASIYTSNIDESKEINSLKIYQTKMDEYILGLRKKWNYQSLKLKNNKAQMSLSTIYSVQESQLNVHSFETNQIQESLGRKISQKMQECSPKKSQYYDKQLQSMSTILKSNSIQNQITEESFGTEKKDSNNNNNFNNMYFENEFTDIKDDDDENINEIDTCSSIKMISQKQASNDSNTKQISFKYYSSNSLDEQTSLDKDSTYFNNCIYNQYRYNSNYTSRSSQTQVSINLPKFFEFNGFISNDDE